MKIVYDIDGTLTDFNKFIENDAVRYFQRKYGFKVIQPNSLEIEEVFDLRNTLQNERGYDYKQADREVKQILDKYWISFKFIKFSLLTRFRKNAAKVINTQKKQGHSIQIHTSRAKTSQNSFVGIIARQFTIWQFWLNGIFLSPKKFHFYPNDKEKIMGIVAQSPSIVFDDKKEIISELTEQGVPVICVAGKHNSGLFETRLVQIINEFDIQIILQKMKNLLGKRLDYYSKEAIAYHFFNKLRVLRPVILTTFHPVILNKQNILMTSTEGIVIAPNHRSTLDPIVITGILNRNVHWAALLRFFTGEDSIFNNSKSPVLCKLTAKCFKRLEYFPIERKCDNPNASNFSSIKHMLNFLKINSSIGIFAEGTTRRPEGHDFGTFDDAFLLLSEQTGAWIQPVTTLWIRELGLSAKVIVNFGEAFKVENLTIPEAMEHFLKIQMRLLDENKKKREELALKSSLHS